MLRISFPWTLIFLALVCNCSDIAGPVLDDASVATDADPDGSTSYIGQHDECGNGMDDDEDGEIDEGCPCSFGERQACFSGTYPNREVGLCADGIQECIGDESTEFGVWGPCLGDTLPAEELCDELDNNCDGSIDENCPCIAGQSRVCGVEFLIEPCTGGVQTCLEDGSWTECEGAIGPEAELCDDGIDNDCDGKVDELCGCDPLPEICDDGNDNDCDGLIDEGCDCEPTEEVCDDSIDNDCDGQIDENCGCIPEPEICDGIDNDCDGVIDESCGCVPTAEICDDEIDNDCDGQVDEGCGCDPVPEVCDGIDNDCDGQVDETGCDVTDGGVEDGDPIDCIDEVCGNGFDDNCDGVVDEDCGPESCECSLARGAITETNYLPVDIIGGPAYARDETGGPFIYFKSFAFRADADETGLVMLSRTSNGGSSLYFAAFANDGSLLGPVTTLSNSSNIAATPVVWTGSGYSVIWLEENNEIVGRRFDAAGNSLGAESVLHSAMSHPTPGWPGVVQSAIYSHGEIVLAWTQCIEGDLCWAAGNQDVFIRRFGVDLVPRGPVVRITNTAERDDGWFGLGFAMRGVALSRSADAIAVVSQRLASNATSAVVTFVRDDTILSQDVIEVAVGIQAALPAGVAYGDGRFLACWRDHSTRRFRCTMYNDDGERVVEPFDGSPTLSTHGYHGDVAWDGCGFVVHSFYGSLTSPGPAGYVTQISTSGVAEIEESPNLIRNIADKATYRLVWKGDRLVAVNWSRTLITDTPDLEIGSMDLVVREIDCR